MNELIVFSLEFIIGCRYVLNVYAWDLRVTKNPEISDITCRRRFHRISWVVIQYQLLVNGGSVV